MYYAPDCGWKSDDLDHSVQLVGYGTTPSGTDYYEIMNSWSDHWGDSGFMKIARDNHACGITTDAVYAIADVDV